RERMSAIIWNVAVLRAVAPTRTACSARLFRWDRGSRSFAAASSPDTPERGCRRAAWQPASGGQLHLVAGGTCPAQRILLEDARDLEYREATESNSVPTISQLVRKGRQDKAAKNATPA